MRRMLVCVFTFFTLGYIASGIACAGNSSVVIDAGRLKLDVTISETATLFHAVDQISQWSEFCHQQYVRYFDGLDGGLNEEDRKLLKEHAVIRSKYDWGALEPAFYTTDDLDTALDKAVKKKMLTEQEAQTEKSVLLHFKPQADRLALEEKQTLAQFIDKLAAKKQDLTTFSEMMSRFVGGAKLEIPFYIIANPDDNSMGGGYNGGRLTLEISGTRDAYPTMLHELFHAFVETKMDALEAACRSKSGPDTQTLSEGLAYAFNPGILHDGGSDQLLQTVAGYPANKTALKDSYSRFNTYGLALRPLLKEALYDKPQTLEAFLPRTVDAWLVLAELDKARSSQGTQSGWENYDFKKDKKHSIFVFGPYDDGSFMELSKTANKHLFGRPHKAEDYKEMLTKNSKPGDTIILLLSLDSNERVPAEFSDLLPSPWADVENQLKQGQVVIKQGKAREMSVFLIAAPTRDQMHMEFKWLVWDKKF